MKWPLFNLITRYPSDTHIQMTSVFKQHRKFKRFMKKQNTKSISGLLLFGWVALLPALGFAEQADNKDIEQPRWFEVEIILYKANSEKGLQNESWDTDTKMKLPEEIIDFLQPFGFVETLESKQQNPAPLSDLGKGPQSSVNQNKESSDASLTARELRSENLAQEKPFVLLHDDLLQLKTEALNISRHVSYDLLAHFSWRQPVLSKREATRLRIAGGFDYQQSYEFSGEKKLEIVSIEKEPHLNNLAPEIVTQTQQSSPTDKHQDGKPVLVALPWVPEIDGSIIVYIHRNYLHLDTDLYYRRPGKEQIDIFDLTSLPSLDDIANQPSTETDLPGLTQQSINTDAFSWQYDDDFLSEDNKQAYTERLFNYPLKQNRRLRSNQLHYFDHPLIGMLVMIRPYELNSEELPISVDEIQGL